MSYYDWIPRNVEYIPPSKVPWAVGGVRCPHRGKIVSAKKCINCPWRRWIDDMKCWICSSPLIHQ